MALIPLKLSAMVSVKNFNFQIMQTAQIIILQLKALTVPVIE